MSRKSNRYKALALRERLRADAVERRHTQVVAQMLNGARAMKLTVEVDGGQTVSFSTATVLYVAVGPDGAEMRVSAYSKF